MKNRLEKLRVNTTLLKALAIANICEQDHVVDTTTGEILALPISKSPDTTLFTVKITIPRLNYKDYLDTLVYVKTNSDGIIYLDGKPYYGLDRFHRIFRIPYGTKEVTIELECHGLWGEKPRSCILEKIMFLQVNRDLLRLVYALEAFIDTASFLARINRRDAAYDLLYLAEYAVRNILSHIGLDPANITYLVDCVDEIWGIDYDLRKLVDGIYWYAVKNPGLLAATGFREINHSVVSHVSKKILDELYNELDRLSSVYGKQGIVYLFAHSHLDMAWLWDVDATRRKVFRTTLNVLRLMEEFRWLAFVQSSAFYYKLLEETSRETYQSVMKTYRKGKWIPVGGMWLEADVALPLGESIVRQFVYGQEFFRKKFGEPSWIAWLPDSFSYPSSLPQIMTKAGIKVLVTHKLEWNKENPFPYTTFYWIGCDGSKILVHVLKKTYGGGVNASKIYSLWRDYGEKDVYPKTLSVYGYCDGGGGPGYDDVAKLEVYSKAPVLPRIETHGLHEFFNEALNKSFPVWSGKELPVDVHHGVYTTGTLLKRLFRRLETTTRDLELLYSLKCILSSDDKCDPGFLDEYWLTILETMFHDVVTGVSRREVTEHYIERIKSLLAKADRTIERLIEEITDGDEGLVLFNTLSWNRVGYAEVLVPRGLKPRCPFQILEEDEEKTKILVEGNVPGIGYSVYALSNHYNQPELDTRSCARVYSIGDKIILENNYLELILGPNGFIESLTKKKHNREAINGPSNVVAVYSDYPGVWNAWDIDLDNLYNQLDKPRLVGRRVVEQGPLRVVVEYTYSVLDSIVKTRYVLYRGIPSLRIEYVIDWRNPGTLAKAWFKLKNSIDSIVLAVPYGSEFLSKESWFKEKLLHTLLYIPSQGLYIATDTPRGILFYNNMIGLSLVKHPLYPDPVSSTGSTNFTIEIGFADNYTEAYKRSRELLHNVIALIKKQGKEHSINTKSRILVSLDSKYTVLEALRILDRNKILARLFNTWRENDLARLVIDKWDISNIYETDLINRLEREITNSVSLGSFEVKTIVLLGK
ncbi:alpha-mannosidase [Desulfurococcaceae archaeon MEX13E-LK6-19]|nr:alpha-mannosidase [Desulfurococcaceae archaeon MEX13E-LK6-19]